MLAQRTDQQHVESRPSETAALLSAVVASSMDAVLSVDTKLTILTWNKAAERLYGYSSEEAIGRWLGMLAPASSDFPGPVFERVFAGEQIYFEAQRKRKDGTIIDVGISSGPIRNVHGEAIGLSIVHRDITERNQAERRLRQTQDWLELAQEAGNVSPWEYDPETGEVRWQQQLFRQLELNSRDVAPSWAAFRERVHPQDWQKLDEVRRQEAAAEPGASFAVELRVCFPDGRISWMDRRSRVIEDNGRRRIIGANVDITARKRQEENLRFVLRELSHRSKNLLAVVQAMASQSIRRSSSFANFEERYLARLRALGQSHDLLVSCDWSGAPLAQLVSLHLLPFMDDESRIEIGGPPIFLKAEAAQALGMVLHELAANAANHGALSTPTGQISIHWWRGDDAQSPVVLTWQERGGPAVASRNAPGYGRTVIDRLTRDMFGGAGGFEFLPEGVRWTGAIPAMLLSASVPAALG